MNSAELDRIALFVVEHSTYTNMADIRVKIEKHFLYYTALAEYNTVGEVIAFCRWNIIDEKTAQILDLIIRLDYRNMGLIRQMAAKGLRLWNTVDEFIYERGYDDGKQVKPMKRYKAIKFTRRVMT